VTTVKRVARGWFKKMTMRGTAVTDSQLLDRFLRERDSASFRSLLGLSTSAAIGYYAK
jgi:hypothetical protein